MSDFERYQHVERIGTPEVDGLLDGICYVFPKIDGTNASVWLGSDTMIHCGSRNRTLSLDNDNAGFCAYVSTNVRLCEIAKKHPAWHIYGEWLVPHTLKTYEDSAWRKFYVFDVVETINGVSRYLQYDEYNKELQDVVDVIPPLVILDAPTVKSLIPYLDKNQYLIKDGMGAGEGVVVKNYDYKNKYGRIVWGKMVRNEFRTQHTREMGTTYKKVMTIENDIVAEFLTQSFVEKERDKIIEAHGGWESRYIAELIGRTQYEFVREEISNIVKKFKNPTIDFFRLNRVIVTTIKRMLPEIFN